MVVGQLYQVGPEVDEHAAPHVDGGPYHPRFHGHRHAMLMRINGSMLLKLPSTPRCR